MGFLIKKPSKVENLTNGYIYLSRVFLLFADKRCIDIQGLGFYIVLGMLMDWDESHTATFGMVKLSVKELAQFLHVSDDSIYRYTKKLSEKGLVSLDRGLGLIWIVHPERFYKSIYAFEIKKSKIAYLGELFAKERDVFAEIQEGIAETRKARLEKMKSSSVKTTVESGNSGDYEDEMVDSKGFNGSFEGGYKGSCDEDLSDEELARISKAIDDEDNE
ncbi:hypothetical protein KJ596_03640 [Patescibacteria group bacterium]|nr:hypothetical protein [Patescibacteria group bacterium]